MRIARRTQSTQATATHRILKNRIAEGVFGRSFSQRP